MGSMNKLLARRVRRKYGINKKGLFSIGQKRTVVLSAECTETWLPAA